MALCSGRKWSKPTILLVSSNNGAKNKTRIMLFDESPTAKELNVCSTHTHNALFINEYRTQSFQEFAETLIQIKVSWFKIYSVSSFLWSFRRQRATFPDQPADHRLDFLLRELTYGCDWTREIALLRLNVHKVKLTLYLFKVGFPVALLTFFRKLRWTQQ